MPSRGTRPLGARPAIARRGFGSRRVPTAELDSVAARAWSPGRFERVRLAYAQGA